MKVLLLIAVLCLASCAPSRQASKLNPCADSTYLSLRAKDLNSMTVREYDYFSRKQRECEQFQASASLSETTRSYTTTAIAISLIGALASFLIIRSAR